MRVILDSSVACFLLGAGRAPPGNHFACTRRLVSEHEHELLLPTPALVEVLAALPDQAQRHDAHRSLERLPSLRIVPFDVRAALVASGLVRKEPRSRVPWQHVKVDAQIVACAFRFEADAICALDGDLARLVTRGTRFVPVHPPEAFLKQVPLPGT